MNAAAKTGFRSAAVLAARCGGAAVGLLTQLLLARSIGPEQLGVVYLAVAIGGVGAIVAAGGYPSVMVRFVRRYLAHGRPGRAAEFVRAARLEALLGAAGLAFLIAGVLFLLPVEENRGALLLGAAMLPAFAMISVNGGLANALRHIGISFVPEVLIRPSLWLVFLAAFLALGLQVDATFAMAAAAAAAVLAALLQAIAVRRISADLTTIKRRDGGRWRRRARSLWRQAAMPMVAVTLLTSLIFDIEALLLAPLMTDADLAVFGIAFKISLLVAFAVHVTQQAAMPDITDAHSAHDPEAMRTAIKRCIVLGAVASALALVTLAAVGRWLLGIFGEGFVDGYPALVILALCPLIRALGGPAPQILVLAGAQRSSLIIYGIGLALLAALNVMLVPAFGVTGAAAAMAVTTSVWSVWLALAAWRWTGVRAHLLWPTTRPVAQIDRTPELEGRVIP